MISELGLPIHDFQNVEFRRTDLNLTLRPISICGFFGDLEINGPISGSRPSLKRSLRYVRQCSLTIGLSPSDRIETLVVTGQQLMKVAQCLSPT